jgi:predicted Abi (CAAX) family protease
MLNHVNNLYIATLCKGFITYFPLGALLPRLFPDGSPVLLGPFGGVEFGLLALDCALAANDPFGTAPPFDFAVAD